MIAVIGRTDSHGYRSCALPTMAEPSATPSTRNQP